MTPFIVSATVQVLSAYLIVPLKNSVSNILPKNDSLIFASLVFVSSLVNKLLIGIEKSNPFNASSGVAPDFGSKSSVVKVPPTPTFSVVL